MDLKALSAKTVKFIPLIALCIGILFLCVHFNQKSELGDEGVTAVNGWRITQGQVPNGDFFEIIPPLSFYALALFYKILGISIFSERMLALLYGLLLLGLTYKVSNQYARGHIAKALPLAALIPCGVGVWPFPSHHWLAAIWLLSALLFLEQAVSKTSSFWAALGGAASAAAVFTLQDQGAYLVLATLVLFFPILGPAQRYKLLAGWMVGGTFVVAFMGIILLPQVSLHALINDWFLFPRAHYYQTGGNTISLSGALQQILGQWNPRALTSSPLYGALIAAESTFIYLLPLTAPLALTFSWRYGWLPRHSLALLTAVTIAFLGAAFHRWSLTNLIWAASAPTICVAILLDRGWNAKCLFFKWAARALSVGLVFVFIAFGVARIYLAKTVPLFPIQTTIGTLRSFNAREAKELQDYLDAIAALVPSGAPAFQQGYIPLVNFLSQHPNPTRYTILLPAYNSREQAEEWIASVEGQNVQWGFSEVDALQNTNMVDNYVHEHFTPVWRNGAFVLWERSGTATQ